MAKEDVFEKEYEDEREKNSLEGLLEQMNLPPVAIKFVKEHKRLVQVGLAVIIIVVVSWALYGSYRENRIQESAAALSSALDAEGQAMFDKLAEVEKSYSGTSSALWAQINIGQQLVKDGKLEEAKQKFTEVRNDLGKSSPLRPLLGLSIAQTEEALSQFSESSVEYKALIDVEGYQDLGYMGLARVEELQGNRDKALEVYEQYLSTMDAAATLQKVIVDEKIARIKAAQ